MARKKELHFFDNEKIFAEKNIDYSEYEKNFDQDEGVNVHGETTPSYIFLEPCMQRIWEYNPNIKLIAVL